MNTIIIDLQNLVSISIFLLCLTILSIAGWVYYCGIEGTLIGTIVSCHLLATVQLYK